MSDKPKLFQGVDLPSDEIKLSVSEHHPGLFRLPRFAPVQTFKLMTGGNRLLTDGSTFNLFGPRRSHSDLSSRENRKYTRHRSLSSVSSAQQFKLHRQIYEGATGKTMTPITDADMMRLQSHRIESIPSLDERINGQQRFKDSSKSKRRRKCFEMIHKPKFRIILTAAIMSVIVALSVVAIGVGVYFGVVVKNQQNNRTTIEPYNQTTIENSPTTTTIDHSQSNSITSISTTLAPTLTTTESTTAASTTTESTTAASTTTESTTATSTTTKSTTATSTTNQSPAFDTTSIIHTVSGKGGKRRRR